jgi:hypothetical protein
MGEFHDVGFVVDVPRAILLHSQGMKVLWRGLGVAPCVIPSQVLNILWFPNGNCQEYLVIILRNKHISTRNCQNKPLREVIAKDLPLQGALPVMVRLVMHDPGNHFRSLLPVQFRISPSRSASRLYLNNHKDVRYVDAL